MMTAVISVLVLVSVVTAAWNGRMALVSASILQSGEQAVNLALTLGGGICLWSGLMKVADKAGFTAKVSSLLYPLTGRLFHGLKKDSPASRAISMNLAANLLGLGNAATPLGIAAILELQKSSLHKDVASDNMLLFVVLNTASIQLIPTTVAMLRQNAGSSAPMEILPAVWLASLVSVSVGVCVAKLFSHLAKPAKNSSFATHTLPRKRGAN